MCGRYGFSVKDAKEVYERFDTYNELADLTARYNVAPGQMNPVITSHSPNEISRMFWGLIPHWAKDDSFKYKTINARSETVATLATFRGPLRHTRCIVPATGFFEPDKINFKKAPFPWHYFILKDQKIGSPGIPLVTGENSLSRRARPLEILGRPLNDVLFSREFRKSQKIFGFAGLYDIWKDKQTGKEIRSYTIITTTPNVIVGQYHANLAQIPVTSMAN